MRTPQHQPGTRADALGAVVAEQLGFDRAPTALTLGQAVTGLSAYTKVGSLGIIEPKP